MQLETLLCDAESNSGLEISDDLLPVIENALSVPTISSISSEDEYREAMRIRDDLICSGLYLLQIRHPLQKEVKAKEDSYTSAITSFNNKLLITNVEAKRLARYLAWQTVFTSKIDHIQMLIDAVKYGVLRKLVTKDDGLISTRLFVYGLKYKVGDNSFSVCSRGREHRCYLDTIGRQAIPVTVPDGDLENFLVRHESMLSDVPDLDLSLDYITGMGNRKGLIKTVPFGSADQLVIAKLYDKVSITKRPQIKGFKQCLPL